ncbi:MAG: Uma2 family endonuclease [Pseudomonadota bacterium]
MNYPHRPPVEAPTKYRLTVDDVFKMQDAGVLPPDHRFELIHGDLIEMPSEGDLHSYVKARLIWHFNRFLDPALYAVGPDTTFFLEKHEAPEPDIFLHAADLRPSQVRGENALLVIEIANTSLDYDLTEKADLYLGFGVREYWVIDVQKRVTHVHLLDGKAWRKAEPVAFTEQLRPTLVDGADVRLSDLIVGV